ncbi:unnamed protein product [Gongylonema pulchrum]|uniref:FLZ-type domain-containing protein n=1 Tax=Gongylonema pulchrum TaxID=637853 RepID=A0A183EJ12_9BILA|nr:unnamed protein product [Gongylonema pulchrum]
MADAALPFSNAMTPEPGFSAKDSQLHKNQDAVLDSPIYEIYEGCHLRRSVGYCCLECRSVCDTLRLLESNKAF